MKRCVDFVAASLGLILLSPVLLVIAMLNRILLGSPVFFRQERPGLHGEPFLMIKFRTMTNACDGAGHPLPDAERLTGYGSFLRKTSLDELPALWNVVKGELSLVGPRPLLMEYLPLYSPEQARRHDVKPGITGWAQINGRNSRSWEEKFELDVWYVQNQSFWLDVRILFRTVGQIVRPRAINAPGHATMPKFTGTVAGSTASDSGRGTERPQQEAQSE